MLALPTVYAVVVGGGGFECCLDHPFLGFGLIYRLKYCLKGPLNPKQAAANHQMKKKDSAYFAY